MTDINELQIVLVSERVNNELMITTNSFCHLNFLVPRVIPF